MSASFAVLATWRTLVSTISVASTRYLDFGDKGFRAMNRRHTFAGCAACGLIKRGMRLALAVLQLTTIVFMFSFSF